jgi:hypothetical protein
MATALNTGNAVVVNAHVRIPGKPKITINKTGFKGNYFPILTWFWLRQEDVCLPHRKFATLIRTR